MNVSREEKKIEAVVRMKKLGIYGPTIEQFEQENLVSISEPPFGAFFWAEGADINRIREFEEEYNALVFMVVRSYTTFGKMDSFLYISDYLEEWEFDNQLLDEKKVYAYIYNHDMPDCSEIGSIGVRLTAAAGLARTW